LFPLFEREDPWIEIASSVPAATLYLLYFG
jgi:hypothetical protein